MSIKTRGSAKKSEYILKVIESSKNKALLKQIAEILERDENQHSDVDKSFLMKNKRLVGQYRSRAKQKILKHQRLQEVIDEPQLLAEKCKHLAKIIDESQHIVIYTGAGISTSASIPDYRGREGIWTKLQQGKTISLPNIVDCQPTYTHMTIELLQRLGKVQHVVSQNCDGLHVRSGLRRASLSELHGNMYIEKCLPCDSEYVRLFDVTEKTAYRHHSTSRSCTQCSKQLTDTIVHFGETSKLHSPYKWEEAVREVNKADLILCIGSSLKILKSYSCLWSLDKKLSERPKICIINLQWTCKDNNALLKINAKCDDVMQLVMGNLKIQVNDYKRSNDPLFGLAVPVTDQENMDHIKNLTQVSVSKDESPLDQPIRIEQSSWFGQGLKKRKIKKKKEKFIVIS